MTIKTPQSSSSSASSEKGPLKMNEFWSSKMNMPSFLFCCWERVLVMSLENNTISQLICPSFVLPLLGDNIAARVRVPFMSPLLLPTLGRSTFFQKLGTNMQYYLLLFCFVLFSLKSPIVLTMPFDGVNVSCHSCSSVSISFIKNYNKAVFFIQKPSMKFKSHQSHNTEEKRRSYGHLLLSKKNV